MSFCFYDLPLAGDDLIHPAVAEDYPLPPDWGVHGDLAAARVRMDASWGRDLTPPGAVSWEQRPAAGGLPPLRLYRAANAPERAPCLLFFHGGGFYGGSAAAVHHPCLYLAWRLGGMVVSVDYPLAPERPYPQALEACAAVLDRVQSEAASWGADGAAIRLAGDSAGGNLALCLALRTLDRGEPAPAALGLLYPVLQVGDPLPPEAQYDPDYFAVPPEHPQAAVALGLTRTIADVREEMEGLYLDGGAGAARYRSPLLEQLPQNLPPVFLAAAEFDSLRRENELFARRLRREGFSGEYRLYRGVPHAFMDALGRYPQAEDCLAALADFLLKCSH
jgi:acetyl esterase